MKERWNGKDCLVFYNECIVVVLAEYGMGELLQVGDTVLVGKLDAFRKTRRARREGYNSNIIGGDGGKVGLVFGADHRWKAKDVLVEVVVSTDTNCSTVSSQASSEDAS